MLFSNAVAPSRNNRERKCLKHFRSSLVGVKKESCTGSDQECTRGDSGDVSVLGRERHAGALGLREARCKARLIAKDRR